MKRKGLTPDIIKELDKVSLWNLGYKYYNGDYKTHQINNFEILSNPNNPDELYIIKDGSFLLSTNYEHVRIYNQGSKLPNPSDTAIDWNGNDLIYYNDEQAFYDHNLDGIDMITEKKPFIGDEFYHNYEEVVNDIPRDSIIHANVPGKECFALIKNAACCPDDTGGYEVYTYGLKNAWSRFENQSSKVFDACNSNNIEKDKKELVQNLFDD